MLNEEFLYFIWQRRLIEPKSLRLTNGDEVEILHPGYRNHESGPDFFNARLRIDSLLWAGNVEIHVKASDWNRHSHHFDEAYDKVVLHVVHEADKPVMRANGKEVPTLEIKGKFPEHYLHQYENLLNGASHFVPCSRLIPELPAIEKASWLNRMLIERLESKFRELAELDRQSEGRMPLVFYRVLAKAFGFKINAVPFELLASGLPWEIVQRHRDKAEELEALFFGQSGLLPFNTSDPYPLRLKRHYRFFKNKYNLGPISSHLWKFGGLRPGNFPTQRISQFAMLLHFNENLTDRIISAIDLTEATQLFEIRCSDYWQHHYHFGSDSRLAGRKLGQEAIISIFINAVIPFLFYFGKTRHHPVLVDKALYWMEKCPPENNRIIKSWSQSGIIPSDAGQSQGLYQLKKAYCDDKKCVICGFGQYFLGR